MSENFRIGVDIARYGNEQTVIALCIASIEAMGGEG